MASHLWQKLRPLHPAALRLLELIMRLEKTGKPITTRVLLDNLGLRSLNALSHPLRRLREEGLITWEHGKAGTLRATCYFRKAV